MLPQNRKLFNSKLRPELRLTGLSNRFHFCKKSKFFSKGSATKTDSLIAGGKISSPNRKTAQRERRVSRPGSTCITDHCTYRTDTESYTEVSTLTVSVSGAVNNFFFSPLENRFFAKRKETDRPSRGDRPYLYPEPISPPPPHRN